MATLKGMYPNQMHLCNSNLVLYVRYTPHLRLTLFVFHCFFFTAKPLLNSSELTLENFCIESILGDRKSVLYMLLYWFVMFILSKLNIFKCTKGRLIVECERIYVFFMYLLIKYVFLLELELKLSSAQWDKLNV